MRRLASILTRKLLMQNRKINKYSLQSNFFTHREYKKTEKSKNLKMKSKCKTQRIIIYYWDRWIRKVCKMKKRKVRKIYF